MTVKRYVHDMCEQCHVIGSSQLLPAAASGNVLANDATDVIL
jgi:hypothetical protein